MFDFQCSTDVSRCNYNSSTSTFGPPRDYSSGFLVSVWHTRIPGKSFCDLKAVLTFAIMNLILLCPDLHPMTQNGHSDGCVGVPDSR